MHVKTRLKKLEEELLGNQEIWAVFTVGCYDHPHKSELTKNRLLSKCIV